MKRFPLMALFAATLTLGGCAALDDLAQEALNWLEETRGDNPLASVEDPSEYDDFHEGDYQGDPFFDGDVDDRDDFGDEVFFFPIKDKDQWAVAELEFDDGDQGLYLYLEFERNDAFIPLEPDPRNDTSSEWAFTAVPNFNQATEEHKFEVYLNDDTLDGRFEYRAQEARLISKGSGDDLRIIGIHLPGKGEYGFHREESASGALND